MEKPHISVVVPVYGCETTLVELYLRLEKTLIEINQNFEIILVNDASPDNAWNRIVEIAKKDKRVKGINLSRNFGQHHAITAGLNNANGEWVVVMDCDLQDRPEEIESFYAKVREGFDIVLGRRIQRKDSFFKRISSYMFYKAFKFLTNTEIDGSVGTYRMLSRKVVSNYIQLNEQSRFFAGLINWLGFKVSYIDIKHAERTEGKSSYTFYKLVKMALNNVLSFSDKPLRLCIGLGFLLSIISGAFIFYKILVNLIIGTNTIGWTSIIATIFFSTGVIIIVLGVVGLYVGRIFEETKRRPLFIVDSTINL